MLLRFMLGIILVSALTGCATTKSSSSINQLQTRVEQLENDLEEQDRDISDIKDTVEDIAASVDGLASSMRSSSRASQSSGVSIVSEGASDTQDIIRVSASPEEVQRALKGAGYYTGAIDGKLGSGSQKAIKDFQRDKGMTTDGIVGRQTWAALKEFLQ